MFRDMTPLALWRDSLCFWFRMAQANAEMTLRMWQAAGLPPPRPLDRNIEALCDSAARPADVPDPAPPRRPRARPAPRTPAAGSAAPVA